MQAFLDLISLLLLVAAGLTLIAGGINTLFGWDLGLRIGGSSIPLPDDFVTVLLLAIALVLLSGFFYAIADLKRTGAFLKKNRWSVLGALAVAIAAIVVGVASFAPNLSLELAVQNGNSVKAEKLLEQRDYPVAVLNDLTYWSLKNEDYPLTEKIVAEGADLNHRRGEFNTTLLHEAVLFFPASATEFLINQGIDVNAQDDLGRTALHHLLSYRAGNIEGADEAKILAIAQMLVDAGTDISIESELGNTALSLAENKNYPSIVTLLQSL